MDRDYLRKQVNSSGFPFQLRVAREVSETRGAHGWQLIAEEHRWSNGEQEGFIDLVLRKVYKDQIHYRAIPMFLILECKRVKQGGWVFLPSALYDEQEISDRSFLAGSNLYEPRWWKIHWFQRAEQLERGPVAAFCAVPGQSDKGTPMLERVAGQLVQATEAYAHEYDLLQKDNRENVTQRPAFFLPILVTNAPLLFADFAIDSINLEEGILQEKSLTLNVVPFVRFRKTFVALPIGENRSNRIDLANQQNQRTVWVVHAPYLKSFLERWFLLPDDNFPDNIFG